MRKILGGCLTVIGGVVVLLFVVVLAFGCMGSKGGSTGASSEPETAQEQQAEPAAQEKDEAKQEEEPEADAEPEPEPEQAPETEPSDADETSIRPEFKDAMDSYEAFFDEYVDFMKAYEEDPTNAEMLMQLSDMMSREADMLSKFEAWENDEGMTTAESAYYLEVSSRIYAKLAEVM